MVKKFHLAKEKKASQKRAIILAALGLAVLVGALLALDRKGLINLPLLPDKKSAQTTQTHEGVNYSPPTQQEKDETEQFKDNLGDQSTPTTPTTPTSPSPTNSTKKSITPIMTSWGANPNVEVRGYVPGISEENGTCTVTLTKDGQKVTESATATPDATTVSCGLITIAKSRVSAGTWSATLSYSSAKYEGVSASKSIEVK